MLRDLFRRHLSRAPSPELPSDRSGLSRRRRASRPATRTPLCGLANPEQLEARRVLAVTVSQSGSYSWAPADTLIISLNEPGDEAYALYTGGLLQVANSADFADGTIKYAGPAPVIGISVADTSSGYSTVLTSPGSGYTSMPSLDHDPTFGYIGGDASVPADPRIGLQLEDLTINSGGAYTTFPTATVKGTSNSGAFIPATVSLTGSLVTGTLNSGGAGYLDGTYALTITGGGGGGGIGTFKVAGNVVTGYTITSGGAYTSMPTLSFLGAGGGGASASPVVTISDATITNPGFDYTSFPTISISPGGGGGSISAICKLSSIVQDTTGNGYYIAPEMSVIGGGGSGAKVDTTFLPAVAPNQTFKFSFGDPFPRNVEVGFTSTFTPTAPWLEHLAPIEFVSLGAELAPNPVDIPATPKAVTVRGPATTIDILAPIAGAPTTLRATNDIRVEAVINGTQIDARTTSGDIFINSPVVSSGSTYFQSDKGSLDITADLTAGTTTTLFAPDVSLTGSGRITSDNLVVYHGAGGNLALNTSVNNLSGTSDSNFLIVNDKSLRIAGNFTSNVGGGGYLEAVTTTGDLELDSTLVVADDDRIEMTAAGNVLMTSPLTAVNGSIFINAATGTITGNAAFDTGSATTSNVTLTANSGIDLKAAFTTKNILGTVRNVGDLTLIGDDDLDIQQITVADGNASLRSVSGNIVINDAVRTLTTSHSITLNAINGTIEGGLTDTVGALETTDLFWVARNGNSTLLGDRSRYDTITANVVGAGNNLKIDRKAELTIANGGIVTDSGTITISARNGLQIDDEITAGEAGFPVGTHDVTLSAADSSITGNGVVSGKNSNPARP